MSEPVLTVAQREWIKEKAFDILDRRAQDQPVSVDDQALLDILNRLAWLEAQQAATDERIFERNRYADLQYERMTTALTENVALRTTVEQLRAALKSIRYLPVGEEATVERLRVALKSIRYLPVDEVDSLTFLGKTDCYQCEERNQIARDALRESTDD